MTFGIRLFIVGAALLLVGCERGAPATTKTNSSGFATVGERARFVEQYVSFRRTYETLDFDIVYQNNGGGAVPGPSDWDLRLVATVPASELQAWVPAGKRATSAADTAWLKTVPTTLDLSGITEWYADGTRVVGIDRGKRVVAYRLAS